jgi:hypothetical protein
MTSEAAVAHFSVWYVAQPTASQISAQLDWILGFQIHRALHRPLLETPSRVSEIAKLHEIDMPKPMAAGVGEAPIIVSVSRRLPVQLLVVRKLCRYQMTSNFRPRSFIFQTRC